MRISRLLTAALTASLAFGVVAAAPAAIDGDETTVVVEGEGEEPTEPEVELYEPCANPGGAMVITLAEGFNGTVPTPIGAVESVTVEDAGTYILDLAGLEVGTKKRLTMTLSWDTPVLGDYDLVINGTNDLSTDSPESHSLTLAHCSSVKLETVVFIGTPLDTLTLSVSAK